MRVDVDVVGVALEKRDLVVLDEFPGDGTADGPGPGDGDLHAVSTSSLAGGSAAMANASAMCPEIAAMYT